MVIFRKKKYIDNNTYGADNLRASKTVNGVKTTFAWNGQNLANETANNVTTVYSYDPTGIITSKTGNYPLVRFVKDPHGNVVATSENNSVFGTYIYTAFGNQIESTDTENPFRYCGEYYDSETGLTYLRNRYYSSASGRFLNEDPIKDGLNWYVYCNNNPVMNVDPSGMISDGANIYLEYYNNRSIAAQAILEEIKNSGYEDWEIEEAEYRCQDEVTFCETRSDDIIKLDEQGLVEGKRLDVPVYNQYEEPDGYDKLTDKPYNGSNLCWAACAAMWISFLKEDNINRTAEIAIKKAGNNNYNVPRKWQSLNNCGYKINEAQNEHLRYKNSQGDIKHILNQNSPFAVNYRGVVDGRGETGHYVLCTGYGTAPGHDFLVCSNDPAGGVKNIQTYQAFEYYKDGRKWEYMAI